MKLIDPLKFLNVFFVLDSEIQKSTTQKYLLDLIRIENIDILDLFKQFQYASMHSRSGNYFFLRYKHLETKKEFELMYSIKDCQVFEYILDENKILQEYDLGFFDTFNQAYTAAFTSFLYHLHEDSYD